MVFSFKKYPFYGCEGADEVLDNKDEILYYLK